MFSVRCEMFLPVNDPTSPGETINQYVDGPTASSAEDAVMSFVSMLKGRHIDRLAVYMPYMVENGSDKTNEANSFNIRDMLMSNGVVVKG